MANIFLYQSAGTHVRMSNGLTAVVFHVLLLAGSKMASTDWEKRFMTWLAERDQNMIGTGIVGFEVAELDWNRTDFSEQRKFILSMIEAAIDNEEWNNLPYNPRVDWVIDRLNGLWGLFAQLKPEDIEPEKHSWYIEPEKGTYEKCEIHGIYLNHFKASLDVRCQLCNDK